jgi:hypothetical protein
MLLAGEYCLIYFSKVHKAFLVVYVVMVVREVLHDMRRRDARCVSSLSGWSPLILCIHVYYQEPWPDLVFIFYPRHSYV